MRLQFSDEYKDWAEPQIQGHLRLLLALCKFGVNKPCRLGSILTSPVKLDKNSLPLHIFRDTLNATWKLTNNVYIK